MSIVSFAVALAGFLLILGISAFSIVFNLLLKKLEQEKQARAVTEDLILLLKSRRVRVDSRHMRVIYDQFKILGKEEYISKLLDEAFFTMQELSDSFFTQEISRQATKKALRPRTKARHPKSLFGTVSAVSSICKERLKTRTLRCWT